MGILGNLFKGGKEDKIIELAAPASGVLKDISGVSDETFAQKILGDGVAITPTDGRICSPCDGVIDNMFETGHAVSVVSDEGTEILIHAGFDTVMLKGEHFKVHKNTGERVKTGDLMVEMDVEEVKKAGYDETVVMVILNGYDYKGLEKSEGEAETGVTVLKMAKK